MSLMGIIAMEWGFKACERGLNLEAAREEYQKLTAPQPKRNPPGIYRLWNGGMTHLPDPRPVVLRACEAADSDNTGRKHFKVGRNYYAYLPEGSY